MCNVFFWKTLRSCLEVFFYTGRPHRCYADMLVLGGCFLSRKISRWWFYFFIFTPIFGEMIQFDEHIFQMGWNHQLDLGFSFFRCFACNGHGSASWFFELAGSCWKLKIPAHQQKNRLITLTRAHTQKQNPLPQTRYSIFGQAWIVVANRRRARNWKSICRRRGKIWPGWFNATHFWRDQTSSKCMVNREFP